MKTQVYMHENVISEIKTPTGMEIVLLNGTKLSHVFHALPSGIINKTETGIGATTLELQARRNSIIVEPIKVTASLKAKSRTHFLHSNPDTDFAIPGAIYVGSEIAGYRKPLVAADILAYHQSPGFKKILVVADSLPKVIKAIGPEVYQDYFLMIDEADAFQLDSTYRESMSSCIDIFRLFPDNNRALVSATMLEFSDPEINSLTKTLVKYVKPTSYDIDLFLTDDNLHGTAVEVISKIVSSHPGEKVLVAYNSPSGCYNIASKLQKDFDQKNIDQWIMCSQASKGTVGTLYKELDTNQLPGRVNYITSAYFSGFDLKENFHVICISDGRSPIMALSEHKIKQIAGRCRKDLLSLSIIYTTVPYSGQCYSKLDLIQAAEQEVVALNCFRSRYGNNRVLSENLFRIRKLLMESDDGIQYARWAENGEPCVSYLNIDAKLEAQRVRKFVYGDDQQLPDVLGKSGHKVRVKDGRSNIQVADQGTRKADRLKQVDEIIAEVRLLPNLHYIEDLSSEKNWTSLQKRVLSTLNRFNPYVDRDQLIEKVEETFKQNDERVRKNFEFKLIQSTYSKTSEYKRKLSLYFQLGQSYTLQQQVKNWNLFFQDMGWQIQVRSKDKASKFTQKHFKVKVGRRGKPTEILSDNPLDITVKRYRDDEEKTLNELYNLLR